MANPTTNYGFVLPTATDLVTDLPADFDVALQGVDTRLKALQPGTTLGDIAYSSATANTNTRLPIGTSGQVLAVSGGGVPAWTTTADVTPLTTKGDLFTFTTVDARLGVGTNGQVLQADSTASTGLAWATPSGWNPNFQLINTGGTALTGAATITVSLSGKNEIMIFAQGASTTSGGRIAIRLNTDSGTNYYWTHFSATNDTTLGVSAAFPSTYFNVGDTVGNTGTLAVFAQFSGTNAAGIKPVAYGSVAETGTGRISVNGQGYYAGTSAITSVSLVSDGGGNFDAGTIYVYGA